MKAHCASVLMLLLPYLFSCKPIENLDENLSSNTNSISNQKEIEASLIGVDEYIFIPSSQVEKAEGEGKDWFVHLPQEMQEEAKREGLYVFFKQVKDSEGPLNLVTSIPKPRLPPPVSGADPTDDGPESPDESSPVAASTVLKKTKATDGGSDDHGEEGDEVAKALPPPSPRREDSIEPPETSHYIAPSDRKAFVPKQPAEMQALGYFEDGGYWYNGSSGYLPQGGPKNHVYMATQEGKIELMNRLRANGINAKTNADMGPIVVYSGNEENVATLRQTVRALQKSGHQTVKVAPGDDPDRDLSVETEVEPGIYQRTGLFINPGNVWHMKGMGLSDDSRAFLASHTLKSDPITIRGKRISGAEIYQSGDLLKMAMADPSLWEADQSYAPGGPRFRVLLGAFENGYNQRAYQEGIMMVAPGSLSGLLMQGYQQSSYPATSR